MMPPTARESTGTPYQHEAFISMKTNSEATARCVNRAFGRCHWLDSKTRSWAPMGANSISSTHGTSQSLSRPRTDRNQGKPTKSGVHALWGLRCGSTGNCSSEASSNCEFRLIQRQIVLAGRLNSSSSRRASLIPLRATRLSD